MPWGLSCTAAVSAPALRGDRGNARAPGGLRPLARAVSAPCLWAALPGA